MTARFLLDTDWVIDHFNGIATITRCLEQLRPSGLALSVVPLTELLRGRALLTRSCGEPANPVLICHRAHRGARRRRDLRHLRPRARETRQQGKTVGDFDLLIAATGLRHGLIICTNNRRHLEVIDGVQLIEIA